MSLIEYQVRDVYDENIKIRKSIYFNDNFKKCDLIL